MVSELHLNNDNANSGCLSHENKESVRSISDLVYSLINMNLLQS